MIGKSGLVAVLLLLLVLPARAAEEIRFLTEENPPYNFLKDGQVRGIAVDLLLAMGREANRPIRRSRIELLPWPRAYRLLQHRPNTVLFSTARTREREDRFLWVGPIIELTIGVIAPRARHLRPRSVADLAGLRIGTILNGAPEQLLLARGLSAEYLDRVTTPGQNVRKLAAGRIDALAFNTTATHLLMEEMGIDPEDYETILVLKQARLYYAFSQGSDPALVRDLGRALETLRSRRGPDGLTVHDRIVNGYLGHLSGR